MIKIGDTYINRLGEHFTVVEVDRRKVVLDGDCTAGRFVRLMPQILVFNAMVDSGELVQVAPGWNARADQGGGNDPRSAAGGG